MNKKAFIILIYCIWCFYNASAGNDKDTLRGAGDFSIGVRTTVSTFTDVGSTGMGSGGEFRIRISKHLNTEWFGDYLTTDIQGLGFRRDAHIGWSVLFYLNKNPLKVKTITPYFIAGHCFDYTRVYSMSSVVSPQERWSSAVQGGFGVHYNFTSRFDLSFLSQYMLHLGTDVESNIVQDATTGGNYLQITKKQGALLEGHLLFTVSANYCIGHLWRKK